MLFHKSEVYQQVHAVPECCVQFGSFHLRNEAVDSGQIQKKLTELVGMDQLVHTELLYSVRLQSGNKTAEAGT